MFTDSDNVIADEPLSPLSIATSLHAIPFQIDLTGTLSNVEAKSTTPFSILPFPNENRTRHLKGSLIFILGKTSKHPRKSAKVLDR